MEWMSRQHLLYDMSKTRVREFQQFSFDQEVYRTPFAGSCVSFVSNQGQVVIVQADTLPQQSFSVVSSANVQGFRSCISFQKDIVTINSYTGVATLYDTVSNAVITPSTPLRFFTCDPVMTSAAAPSRLDAFGREKEAFLRLKDDLMRDFEEKYVAILHGKVVDSDKDQAHLAQRVYGKYGYVQIYIDKVSKETRRKLENPSPENIRSL